MSSGIKREQEFRSCGSDESRSFGPAGPTFFSLVGKEGKSTPRGKGTHSRVLLIKNDLKTE